MVNDLRVGKEVLNTNSLNYWYTNGLTHAGADIGIPGFNGDVLYANPGIPNIADLRLSERWATVPPTGFRAIRRGRAPTLSPGLMARTPSLAERNCGNSSPGRSAVNSADGIISFDGSLTGYAAADFVLGTQVNDTTPSPEIFNRVAEWRDGFFVVDNWKATASDRL